MRTQYRLGVDAGGTFTDFVIADGSGAVRLFKTPSTPHDPTIAIGEGLQQISRALGKEPKDIVGACDLCINGTTVALNALIQHKGTEVGLLCTAGHEDSIEIRLGHKEEGHRYDQQYPPVKMLAPRYLRRPIRERVLSDGSVYTPLNEDDVREAVELFIKEGVRGIGVSFLWSVLRPEHEQRAGEIVREMMPEAFVSLGTEIYPQTREYTRTSTTVMNVYLGPLMQTYVTTIDDYFQKLGAKFPVRFFQSNGGLAIGDAMAARSVYAINSGPASAPQAGLFVAQPFGFNNVITVDMGGTSFDITLTKDGRTNINKDYDFLRYRIGVPMIQVESLGAGGGSIAHIDHMGMLVVGPQSAGAEPGPVCYGKGGTEPTVSDANLVLGYFPQKALLGGQLPLDREAAAKAIKNKIADPLGISLEKAAHGIYTIVNNNMVNGIRRVSVERGFDPRDFILVGAGGATAAHITSLAREMGIKTVLVPKLASGLCAFGQIISDVKYNFLDTCPMRLDDNADLDLLNTRFEEMEKRAVDFLKADGFEEDRIDIGRSIDMRYVDQVHECEVEIGTFKIDRDTAKQIRDAFDARHEQLFTYSEPHNIVEIVNLESTIYGRIKRPKSPVVERGGADPGEALSGTRPMIFSRDGSATDTPVYDGEKVKAGNKFTGPAVIEEVTTTLVLEPGWEAELDERGTYVLKDKG